MRKRRERRAPASGTLVRRVGGTLISLLLAASAAEPASLVAGLFPSAETTTVDGKPAIAPVVRNGQVGYVLLDGISSVPMADGATLLAFELDTAAGVEKSTEALTAARNGGTTNWTRVLGVVLVDAKGAFVSKPEGFPLEKEIDTACVGDFCALGPRGALVAVEGSTRYAILMLEPDPESMGTFVPLRVTGSAIEALEARQHGTAGGLTGCPQTAEWNGFREKEGQLKAMRMKQCHGDAETCADICREAGYPLEATLSPVVLAK
ncbi:MAG: hypothetical protein H6737_21320 [Alphaproteobacteria bacterium]|nr:hypothetical protein [Alphaproteobacteria bacterium]